MYDKLETVNVNESLPSLANELVYHSASEKLYHLTLFRW